MNTSPEQQMNSDKLVGGDRSRGHGERQGVYNQPCARKNWPLYQFDIYCQLQKLNRMESMLGVLMVTAKLLLESNNQKLSHREL